MIIDRWRNKHAKNALPSLIELERIADSPLSEEEKIPLSPSRFNDLISSVNLRDICTEDDVRVLFDSRPGGGPLDEVFFTVAKSPPDSGTEDFFISFWDRNIRDILEIVVPAGRSLRNSNFNTATGNLRPDYGFLVDDRCVFRGEEKPPRSTDDPREELVSKLEWVYTPAPFVLGRFGHGGVSDNLIF
jgi:hypothetical protein